MKVFPLILLLAAASSFGATLWSVIPIPRDIQADQGVFSITRGTRVVADRSCHDSAEMLASRLRMATGFALPVDDAVARNPAEPGVILLTTDHAKPEVGEEGYELSVTPGEVVIRAPCQAGLFYGAQTLLQLMPTEIFSSKVDSKTAWEIPCARIEDWPRFKWRGLMLDVSRHFFTKDEIKRLLDEMALHKLNTFHWHLTDDQGWRIEIKKYPKLTQVGAWRSGTGFGLSPAGTAAYDEQGRYGGFYTQDDIREIVAYAAARHVTIVPEIEMPGHATAALAAYPEFGCTGEQCLIPLKGGVFNGVLCPGNEATFEFLDEVLAEIAPLFPGEYIHIGGDEVPKKNWKECPKCQALMKSLGLENEDQLQSYFLRRVEKLVNAHGHKLIGWSEIQRGGLPGNAAMMDWIGGAVEAAEGGHDVVRTPIDACYFDRPQSVPIGAPPAANGSLPLERVYAFEPIPDRLAPQFQSHILGAQANIWTENIQTFSRVEYMAFPRLCALAEVAWSPKDLRHWDDFSRRLAIHEERLRQLDVNYYPGQALTAPQPAAAKAPVPFGPVPSERQ